MIFMVGGSAFKGSTAHMIPLLFVPNIVDVSHQIFIEYKMYLFFVDKVKLPLKDRFIHF